MAGKPDRAPALTDAPGPVPAPRPARRPPSLRGLLIGLICLVGFVVWTVLTLTGHLDGLDRALASPRLDPDSPLGQIAAAQALITAPVVCYVAIAALAVWEFRRRLRNVAIALALAAVGGYGITVLLRWWIDRPRPTGAADLITTNGSAYPSGHVTAAVILVIMVTATRVVTRSPTLTVRLWQLGGIVGILAVALNRWVLSAHHVTDLIGGLLWGGFVSTAVLIVADVHILPTGWPALGRAEEHPTPDPAVQRRCAVIVNPVKVLDWGAFRRHIDYQTAQQGFTQTLWLETTPDDPGRAMTATAVRMGVDLVLGAGGDGTIRTVCAGLAGTGIPFGLVPAGTGNLLARNLNIPFDESEALDIAFTGRPRKIDLVRLTVDDDESDYFAVMAGIGIDAAILASTNTELKRAVGSAAYFLAAAQNANHPATTATITVDDEPPVQRPATVMVLGNVGYLQGNIPLIPDARPDDGLLDLLVASPRGPRDWVGLIARVMRRERRSDDRMARYTARRVVIEIPEPDSYELDGDTVGTARKLSAESVPGALTIMVPR